jgi:hypothetical protein
LKVVPGALLRVSMRTATPKYSKLVYTAPKSGKSASPRSLTLAATLLYGGRDAESYALAKRFVDRGDHDGVFHILLELRTPNGINLTTKVARAERT